MAVEAEIHVKERATFVGDRMGRIQLLSLGCVLACVISVGLIVVLRDRITPVPVFFPATEQGQLMTEPPLDQPRIATNELLNWVTEVAMLANTFNFVNADRVIQSVRDYFTEEGYESYQNALKSATVVEDVVKQKFVLQATAVAAPAVTKEGPFAPLGGRYLWKVKLPMEFRYRNMSADFFNIMNVTFVIMRVPSTESPKGIKILRYDLEKIVSAL